MQSKIRTYADVMVQLFDGLSETEAREKVKRLKLVLRKRGDAKRISEILREFARAWKQRKGPIARVVSAEPLLKETRMHMEQSLAKKNYVMEEKVDPAVIGGVALFLGNEYVVDGTARGKLQRIATLLEKSS
ncbi:MAG TPA: hypothetical protein DIS53_02545 [Candidatus Wildermuthbacteria bacterium]|uniref:ATP synthase subunit delta n=2 Tax=Parcubacteria group TaxID=1794811 RepID=A0A837IKW1_9BACT|nr:MAG: hypothetical protein UY25_C0004G0051 [Candidatus Yanofskybacteria bacterium GW2011_GWC1_48_11]KKW04513.1 MAG: hypothetical protein UY38_C0001G0080 [Parcubacteria group bacterium GW2011_GWB1_49_12]KKW09229.1 MAG: hypothetical protein UY45_C0001G0115 [Parcubacteria group bacterium GW2011_GWA1_49_26]KKW14132.1 MAG: hypothetical protein UY53_C0003G0052 [Parcubacteria group bacterium GW2011_GWA2_50_10]OHA69777.1 MAG: hypothetical protein A3D63_00850 [Candidatus Wildermuthbacteria bacterium R